MILMGERITLRIALRFTLAFIVGGFVGVVIEKIAIIAVAPILLNLLYHHPRIIP